MVICALISIHAPSRERPKILFRRVTSRHFNPRSLTGATHYAQQVHTNFSQFQSTLPHGSDIGLLADKDYEYISIHAPSRERLMLQTLLYTILAFQSTLPHGSDPYALPNENGKIISIHAPSRERLMKTCRSPLKFHFNPRSLTGATTVLKP